MSLLGFKHFVIYLQKPEPSPARRTPVWKAAGSRSKLLWAGDSLMMVQMKGDRRNIFAQSGTWFTTMLELTAAAYTIVGSASWEHHRGERLGEGRARHGEISTEYCWPWLHETQKSQELSVCNVQDLLHWAAKLGTTKPTVFTLTGTEHSPGRAQFPDSSVCSTQLCPAAGRAWTLLLPVCLLPQWHGTWGGNRAAPQSNVQDMHCSFA